MTVASPPARFVPPRRFENAAEWLDALGGVPLQRIIFDPWPGTATEADLLLFVERDKRLCELIDGTLVEKPVGWDEAIIAANLIVELGAYVKRTNAGVVSGADSTLRMISGRVRLPDVAFVSRVRLPARREPIPTLSPDLAVEVLSPSNTKLEMAQKLKEYFQSGTRLVWIIDPQTRTIAVHHGLEAPMRLLNEADTLDGGEVLPGFTLLAADLFRDVPSAE